MKRFSIIIVFIVASLAFSQQTSKVLPSQPIQTEKQIPVEPQKTVHNQQQIMEIQHQGRIQQELNQQLPPWIRQELQLVQSVLQLPITESFSFVVESQQQVIFKWDPSKQKELKLIVDVSYITKEGGIVVIKDAQDTQYVQITVKNPNAVFYGLIGKVYRSKILTLDFDTDFKYIKFYNKNSETVIIQIDVQKLDFVVSKGVPDDTLATSRNKMNSILEQSQSTQIRREHLYKWQWGFLQNQKNHQTHILGLTGVQLFAIAMTAIVQMFCLKGLLDNRTVV